MSQTTRLYKTRLARVNENRKGHRDAAFRQAETEVPGKSKCNSDARLCGRPAPALINLCSHWQQHPTQQNNTKRQASRACSTRKHKTRLHQECCIGFSLIGRTGKPAFVNYCKSSLFSNGARCWSAPPTLPPLRPRWCKDLSGAV